MDVPQRRGLLLLVDQGSTMIFQLSLSEFFQSPSPSRTIPDSQARLLHCIGISDFHHEWHANNTGKTGVHHMGITIVQGPPCTGACVALLSGNLYGLAPSAFES